MGKMNNVPCGLFCRFVGLFSCGVGGARTITFTKDGVLTSCTNEMNIIQYILTKSSLE